MYNPPAFQVDDLKTLWSFIDQNSFGLFVSRTREGMSASHLPFLLERNIGEKGRLVGHLARANPQWQDVEDAQVLVVFSGPHAYISPSWYAAVNVVPTWNYVAVHVTGKVRWLHDPDELLPIVRQTVDHYESGERNPWSLDSAEPDFIENLCRAIVGFTIDIDTIEGKWKLSQNHDRQRRERVIGQLEGRSGENSARIASLMRQSLDHS